MIDGLSAAVFGPEYAKTGNTDLGVFEIPAGEPEIDLMIGPRTILPPAGYIFRYVTGEYMLVGSGGESRVGGDGGLQIRWQTLGGDWVTASYPDVLISKYQFAVGWNVDDLMYCELTGPGRIQFVPPSTLHGIVSIRVIQVIPNASIPFQSQ